MPQEHLNTVFSFTASGSDSDWAETAQSPVVFWGITQPCLFMIAQVKLPPPGSATEGAPATPGWLRSCYNHNPVLGGKVCLA